MKNQTPPVLEYRPPTAIDRTLRHHPFQIAGCTLFLSFFAYEAWSGAITLNDPDVLMLMLGLGLFAVLFALHWLGKMTRRNSQRR